jgi:Spy/CpxP family protein refolding chaperone
MEQVKRYAVMAVLVIFVCMSPSVFAQTKPAAKPVEQRAEGNTILDYKEELKLTEVQQEKIKAVMYELGESNKKLYTKATAVDQQLRKLLEEAGEMKDISGKVKESFMIKAQVVITGIEMGRKLEGILTPEQQKQWKDMRIAEMKKMQEEMKRRNTLSGEAK